ncbi:MAG TPA: DUF6456 domain-containing protein [Rhizomicrobium sp.]
MKPAEQEIQREARRVLRKLDHTRAGLVARGGQFVIGRGAAVASRIGVAAEMVREFALRGWIAPDGANRYVIAPGGQAFLARAGEDGFAAQHRLMQSVPLEEGGAARRVAVNMGESPLARLQHRALIDAVQFAAGERLRRDFTLAQLTPRMGVDWSAPVVSGSRGAGGDSISDIALMARQRLNKALAAAGPGLGDLLFDVCCHLTPLERCEDARGWAKRAGRVVLKIALDRLASHYGFDVVRRKAGIRSWSLDAGGGRPEGA